MFIKILRLGKDSVLRTVPNSDKQVLQFTAAYDVGYGDRKRTQWINVSYWGRGNDKLQQYLLKGVRVHAECNELFIEEWESNGEQKHMLKATAYNLTLIDRVEAQQSQQSNQEQSENPSLEDIPF
jgi:single-strand DNA-binding protein